MNKLTIDNILVEKMNNNFNKKDWEKSILEYDIEENILEYFWKEIPKSLLMRFQNLSENFLDKHYKEFNENELLNLFSYQDYSWSFIRKHIKTISPKCWNRIYLKNGIPGNFVINNLDKFNFGCIQNFLDTMFFTDNEKKKIMKKRRELITNASKTKHFKR